MSKERVETFEQEIDQITDIIPHITKKADFALVVLGRRRMTPKDADGMFSLYDCAVGFLHEAEDDLAKEVTEAFENFLEKYLEWHERAMVRFAQTKTMN